MATQPDRNPDPGARAPDAPHPDAGRYLQVLYDRSPGGTYIELRPFAPAWSDAAHRKLAPRWRAWFGVDDQAGLARAAARAAAAGPGLDVYVGVALRRARGGTSRDVMAVTALWAELDGSPSAKGAGCRDKADAWQRLASCPVPPGMIVDSGGGYHAYWLLEDPIVDADALARVPLWNARLRELLRTHDGYAGDDVGDLARILRLPGTGNLKRQHDLRPVVLAHVDGECRYSLEYLDSVLPALPARAWEPADASAGTVRGDRQPEMQMDPERRARMVQEAGLAWSQCEGVRHFLPHPMARVLLASGWPWRDIPDLLHDIAAAGGSADPGARAQAARLELGGSAMDGEGDSAGRLRAGWPWLRQNATPMADALTRMLEPDGDDLRELAATMAATMGVRAPDAEPPPATDAAPAMPPPSSWSYTPGSVASVAITGTPTPETDAPLPPPVALHAIRGGADVAGPAGKGKKGDDATERAAERLCNVLRSHLQWVAVARDDNRPYAGRTRHTASGPVVETVALDGREAALWALEVARGAGLPLTESHRKVALDLLAAEARHRAVDLGLRYARDPDSGDWLVDMGTATWEHVRIGPGTWELEQGDGPLFVRTPCTLPYTHPDGLAQPSDLVDGLVEVLRTDEAVAAQLACWMVQALHPSAPRMGLFVTGPQGSGKSTFARLARMVVDPARPPLIKFSIQKGKEADYAQAAVHKAMLGTLAYSNVSAMNEQTSDLLCGLLTGDGDIRRQLYTDADATIADGRRNLVLEGITVMGMGADLQDRLLHVSLPVRTQFEPEAAMAQRMGQWMPRMVGGLFAAAADALARLDAIEECHGAVLDRCRMRDAAAVYGAAAEAFGLDAGTVLGQLVGDRAEAQGDEAESDVVGQRLLAWVETARKFSTGDVLFIGSLERFDQTLQTYDGQHAPDLWPKSLRALRSKMDRLLPGLRARGIEVEFYRSKGLDRKASVDVRLIPENMLGT